MKLTRRVLFFVRSVGFPLICLAFVLSASHAFAQVTNLVIDSLTGEVDQNEVDTYIGFMSNPTQNPNAVLPTNALGDNLAFGTPGTNLEGLNYMYRIAGDLSLPNNEQLQLMNLAITWSERMKRWSATPTPSSTSSSTTRHTRPTRRRRITRQSTPACRL